MHIVIVVCDRASNGDVNGMLVHGSWFDLLWPVLPAGAAAAMGRRRRSA